MMEIIVSIVIMGVIASLAIPRFTGAFERVRASEGVALLTSLLGAQRAFFLETGGYATVNNDLDITIGATSNFGAYSVSAPDPVAQILRTGSYTLCIDLDGTITCKNGGGGFTCAQAGVPTGCP